MARSQPKQILRSAGYAVVMAVGLSIVSVTGAVGSPEDEIARLNRVRGNLFEELVKTRAEAALPVPNWTPPARRAMRPRPRSCA